MCFPSYSKTSMTQTHDSFTMANSNLFLSPKEILQIALEKYLRKFYQEIVCCMYSLELPH